MNSRALAALVRKDLQLFFGNGRQVVITIITPIALAAFFGFLFSGGGDSEASRIPVRLVDQDKSDISRQISKELFSDKALEPLACDETEAREAVRTGKAGVAVVIPSGFGEAAAKAFFGGENKPEIGFLYDPSHIGELSMVRGILTGTAMEAVGKETFSGASGRKAAQDALQRIEKDTTIKPENRSALLDLLKSVDRWQQRVETSQGTGDDIRGGGLSVPFTVSEEAVTARKGIAYNGYAHSFAGMGLQFILFSGIDLGVGILLERRGGFWKRLRTAPISRGTLLSGKLLAGAIIAFLSLAITFGFGMAVFGIRVHGSLTGFLGLCVASAFLAAAFGLMLAALGGTPESTRGIAIFASLVLVMLGGAWVPAFIFPAWLQKVTLIIPVRWAMDGFDGVLWRGTDLAGAAPAIGVTAIFAVVFTLVAVWRFHWEE